MIFDVWTIYFFYLSNVSILGKIDYTRGGLFFEKLPLQFLIFQELKTEYPSNKEKADLLKVIDGIKNH